VYATVLVAAIIARLALEWESPDYVSDGQRLIWSWPFFLVFAACYAAAIAIARRTRIPAPAETLARPLIRLGLPALVGVVVALLTIASDLMQPVALARGVSSIHVQGWQAVPFYTYGAIVLTTVFHFLPVALLAWLVQELSGARRTALVGIGIAAIAFSEDAGYFVRGASLDIESARHVLSVVANAAEALFIYRFGFLAGLAQRASTYLVWHGLWPLAAVTAQTA
jgi:hypothetical protein